MRNLPFIIAGLLVLLLLAVGLWSRNYSEGPQRSVQFGTDLLITTRLPDPVAVIVSVVNPDGTTTPLAWACLGDVEGTMKATPVTFPTSVVLVVQFASGMNVAPSSVVSPGVTTGTANLVGGAAAPGTVMTPIAGLSVTLNGTASIFITPGTMTSVLIHSNGVTTSMIGTPTAATPSGSLPPIPPLPPPPPAGG